LHFKLEFAPEDKCKETEKRGAFFWCFFFSSFFNMLSLMVHGTRMAQSIIESLRGIHAEYVFPYPGHRIETMNNNAWQRARRLAGIPDLHIHDLRHTVGMRLRGAGARKETIADILWHTRQGITAHYSVVQIDELVEALNHITNEGSRINRSLAMLRQERFEEKSPHRNENGLDNFLPNPLIYWRARRDSNPLPLASETNTLSSKLNVELTLAP